MNLKRWIAAAGGMLVLAGVLGGCSQNPTTGRSQLNLLSRAEEIQIGEEAMPELTQSYGGKVASATAQSYLNEVCMSMAKLTEGEAPTLPWEFTLLDSDVVNAFALPGGKTFITKALVERLHNEAELAFVMGHEIGHVTARHQNEQISRQLGAQIAVTVAASAAGAAESQIVQQAVPTLVNQASGLYLLKYGREQELEADQLGMRYMTKAGYDPEAARSAMQVLADLAGDGARPPEFLSTHPYPEARIEQINEQLNSLYAQEMSDPAYRLYPERYQSRMLKPIALLLPGDLPTGEAFALADTTTWCGICAHEHGMQASAEVAP